MDTISNKETSLLMLLSEEPMHAYQIEKIIENRSMRYWTEISMSSIYKLLRGLEGEGLIKSKKKPAENGLVKNVFTLTAKGKKALKDRFKEILSEPEHTRWRIDLVTSHLEVLTKSEIAQSLAAYREKLEEAITGYHDLEAYLIENECAVHALALARRPRYLLNSELEWISSYESEIEEAQNG